MKLGEKIRYLRLVEGTLRGLGREMTQQETVRAIARERKGASRGSISQSYLSQIESGARPHLTNSTRMLLANFFGVHPGYLVSDPEGFHTELVSDARVQEDQLDLWLIGGAERFSRDPQVSQALLHLARQEDSRKCLVLLDSILDTPQLADRLLAVLGPATGPSSGGSRDTSSRSPAPGIRPIRREAI
jgi:transcriptional regulator with XRE-family HTH domain